MRIGRPAACLVIVAYLAATAWFQCRHLLGDSQAHPVSYLFSWDMFPGYATVSRRFTAIGETSRGEFVQIFPSPRDRFRWGKSQDCTRLDLYGAIDGEPGRGWMKRSVESALRATLDRHADDPIETVFIVEEYWPPGRNLTDALYGQRYGMSKPEERAFRVIDEFPAVPDEVRP